MAENILITGWRLFYTMVTMKPVRAFVCVAICALSGVGFGFQSPNTADVMPLLDVTHLTIKGYSPQSDGVNWLHGVALCWHDGRLYASFGVNAVAAKGKTGSLALLVTRSVSGADALGTIPVRLSVAGARWRTPDCT